MRHTYRHGVVFHVGFSGEQTAKLIQRGKLFDVIDTARFMSLLGVIYSVRP